MGSSYQVAAAVVFIPRRLPQRVGVVLQFGGQAVAPFLHGPERVAALDDEAPLVVVLFLVAVGVPDRGVGGGVVLEPGIEDAAVAPGVNAAGRGVGTVVFEIEV